jgi:hypothetical protein
MAVMKHLMDLLKAIFENTIDILEVLSSITSDFFTLVVNADWMDLSKCSYEVPFWSAADKPQQESRSALCLLHIFANELDELLLSMLAAALV